jgi:hypothetical protein
VKVKEEYYYEKRKKENGSDLKSSKQTEEVAMVVGVVGGYPLVGNFVVVLPDRKIQWLGEWV